MQTKSGDDSISLTTLVRYLRDAQLALEEESKTSVDYRDSALRFELLADYLSQDYKPSHGLKFSTRHIGL